MQDAPESDAPPRALMIAALVVAVGGLAAVLAVAATRRTEPQPVVIAAVPAPQAESSECRALLASLPDRLGDFDRAPTAEPTPAGTAAWRPGADDADVQSADPVILRCGLDRPAEFVVGAPLQLVDVGIGRPVQWFRLDDPGSPRSTWVCVDRPTYVILTLPTGSGSAPIQTLSGLIARSMPATPIRPGPAR